MLNHKNDNHPTVASQGRLAAVFFFLFLLFSLLIAQFYKIQVIEEEKWKGIADRQHQLVVIEPYRRGIFYSNSSIKEGHPEKEQPFVIDVPRFHLYSDPKAIPPFHHPEIIQKITQTLDLSSEDKERVVLQLKKRSRSRKLLLWLTREEVCRIKEWWSPYAKSKKIGSNALFFIQDYKRVYPFGKLLGQLLHTIRGEREVGSHLCVPTGGLELSLNPYLSGADGKRLILRSSRQSLDVGKIVVEPRHGADVYLTINHHLQAIAEEEICKAVKTSRAKGGMAIMMNPHTGEIWAWAEYPFFNLSHSQQYFNSPEQREVTKAKAINNLFEPGSIMKPITLAVCLEANDELGKRGEPPLFSIDEKIDTRVGLFPGRKKPLKDPSFHRSLNMYMGLQKSSNIYMAKLLRRLIETLGNEWYRSALQNIFKFGIKTGVELPSESPGLLPSIGKKHPNGKLQWSKSTPYSLAIGHNVLSNSLQILRCYAIFANGGYDICPTLIRKIVKKSGEVIVDNTASSRLQQRVLKEKIAKEVVRAMRFVTKPGGTAQRAAIHGYTEAGKTSTSEKVINGVYSKTSHISAFIGFAPVDSPCFVLLVVIDEPEYKDIPGVGKNQFGGACAAPAFSQIGLRSLQFLGVPQDDPNDVEWNTEVKELKLMYDQWNH